MGLMPLVGFGGGHPFDLFAEDDEDGSPRGEGSDAAKPLGEGGY